MTGGEGISTPGLDEAVSGAEGEPSSTAESQRIAEAVNRLADEYRDRCLWFLRADYYPRTRDERLRVLEYIQRYGDLSAFRRAGELRICLSRISSEKSAG